MKIKYFSLLLVTSCAIIASCAPTVKDFSKYQKQFLAKTNYMPSKESLEGKSSKIAVFPLEENGNDISKQAQLGISMANDIENILSRNRLAELVDRKAVEKLKKEIALAEMNKTGSYKGPQVADFAISGTISNASFNNKYSSGSTYVNPKSGQLVTIPPSFTYSSDVSGNLKIYELPSLAVIESIEFSGNEVRKENVQQKGGLSFGALKIGGEEVKGAERDDGLVRKAGADAIDNASIDLKNSLAKRGYILEKRVNKNKTIFKISLGSLDGIKHGDKFEVMGQYESENPITNQVEIEKRIITSGAVTNLIYPKTSWVVIDDADKSDAVRLGDAVKLKYKKSALSGIVKAAKKMAN